MGVLLCKLQCFVAKPDKLMSQLSVAESGSKEQVSDSCSEVSGQNFKSRHILIGSESSLGEIKTNEPITPVLFLMNGFQVIDK